MSRRRPLDPFTREPREALELITMLTSTGSMHDPTQPHGTAPSLTSLDVAQALAHAQDELGELMAMALACSLPSLREQVITLALPELVAAVRGCAVGEPLLRGAKRYRARVVLHYAFDDLLHPARSVPYREAARELSMRRRDYLWLHRQASGLLDNRARAAAGAARAAISDRGGLVRAAPAAPAAPARPAASRRTRRLVVASTPAPQPARPPKAATPSFLRWGVLSLRRSNES